MIKKPDGVGMREALVYSWPFLRGNAYSLSCLTGPINKQLRRYHMTEYKISQVEGEG
jgi:hypothetical protein